MTQVDLSDRKWRHGHGRYPGCCGTCGRRMPAGETRAWHPRHGERCWDCVAESQRPTAGQETAQHRHVPADQLAAHLDRIAAEREARHG